MRMSLENNAENFQHAQSKRVYTFKKYLEGTSAFIGMKFQHFSLQTH